jgi:magnesium chelatase family protein
LFDRFDVRVVLPPVDVTQLQGSPKGETSSDVQKRVIRARALQHERAQQGTNAQTNAQLSPRDLEQFATPDTVGARILAQAKEALRLSPTAYQRVLRVARTIADLDGRETVRAPHIAEAIQVALFPAPTAATPHGFTSAPTAREGPQSH